MALPLHIKGSFSDSALSECLGSGLEDLKGELIHIGFAGQAKLWVMFLKWMSTQR
jgi:hypothetical protein